MKRTLKVGVAAGEVDQEIGEGAVAYGVAVTKSDGSKVEVHLDKNFQIRGAVPRPVMTRMTTIAGSKQP